MTFLTTHCTLLLYSRYYLTLVVQNIQAFDLLIDKISLSPYCFGLGEGVNDTILEDWRQSMTDEEYCRLYGKHLISNILSFRTTDLNIELQELRTNGFYKNMFLNF